MPKHAADTVERQSLQIGKWGNLLMAAAGIVAAWLSNSDALLVDGLYSGLNFFSAIIAAGVGQAVLRPADRRYPFGYGAYEALYVKYRALVLIGIMAFAALKAVQKIILYASGGQVPDLVFGPILVYTVVMVLICMGLAAWHHYNWRQSGRRSELLKTESRAAVVDGVISGGAGGGLLAAGLLRGTSLEFIVPVADSIVVLVLTAFVARGPIVMFLAALREVAGQSAATSTINSVRKRLEDLLQGRPYSLLHVTVTKLGRTHFVLSYVKPKSPITGEEADVLWKDINTACGDVLTDYKTELIIAAQAPFPK